MFSKLARISVVILVMLAVATPVSAESLEARLAALESQVSTLRYALRLSTLDVPELVAQASPAVVSIYNVTAMDEVMSTGTGWLISAEGLIVTNAHVVDPAYIQKVKFADGTAAVAQVLLRDTFSDLAELQVPNGDYTALPLATEEPGPGETVVVIGNAMGFSNSISVGVVSGVNRQDRTHQYHYPSLQIDAAINFGNSGGPILNSRGEVVAIATWREQGDAVLLGFGIPVSRLRDTLQRTLPDRGTVRPWLGASVKEPYWSRGDALPNSLGLIVTDVHPKSGAYAGGLRSHDYIGAVGDKPVNSLAELRQALEKYKPGDTVVLAISRQQEQDGEWATQHLNVTLGESSRMIPALIPSGYQPKTDDIF